MRNIFIQKIKYSISEHKNLAFILHGDKYLSFTTSLSVEVPELHSPCQDKITLMSTIGEFKKITKITSQKHGHLFLLAHSYQNTWSMNYLTFI